MAFSVYLTHDGEVEDRYEDKDSYEVTAAGVLNVTTHDASFQNKLYSPSGWAYLSADSDHPAGPHPQMSGIH